MPDTRDITIGFFGVPDRTGGLTHLVLNGKALCGTHFHKDAVYQWCIPTVRAGVECERCKKLQRTLYAHDTFKGKAIDYAK